MSILKKLSNEDKCIFQVNLSSDKYNVVFTDACDYYYTAYLNKEEFGQLIDELKQIHSQMISMNNSEEITKENDHLKYAVVCGIVMSQEGSVVTREEVEQIYLTSKFTDALRDFSKMYPSAIDVEIRTNLPIKPLLSSI